MEPLSKRTRSLYMYLLLAAFCIVVPLAILYATGYRLSDLSLSETGGVYVTVPGADVTVSLNGKQIGTSSLFDHTMYVDGLSPGIFVLQATHDGDYAWVKTVVVEPWIVTDAAALMVPTTIPIRELVVGTSTAPEATSTTLALSKAEYDLYTKAFATTTLRQTSGGSELLIANGDVAIRWTRSAESVPSSFCVAPSSCVLQFMVEKGKDVATDARFFDGGVVYRGSSGIYFVDTDVRSPQLSLPLYTRANVDFRIINDALIIKDGKSLYQIDAW